MTVTHRVEQRHQLARPHQHVNVFALLHGFVEPLPTIRAICWRGVCFHQPSHETACMPLTLGSAAVFTEWRVHIAPKQRAAFSVPSWHDDTRWTTTLQYCIAVCRSTVWLCSVPTLWHCHTGHWKQRLTSRASDVWLSHWLFRRFVLICDLSTSIGALRLHSWTRFGAASFFSHCSEL